ncbi:MAG: DUF4469 domain-containing protein, partial [Dysgonamonadaceae bacterium]|jgi:hypothetical protein|nr:DUF4469 domain-containing protein [Dysgonamonadaceae bacterium]
VFDGVEENNGYIGEVVDEATGLKDKVFTAGHILSVYGYGLKIEADAEHAGQAGAFLVHVESGQEIPVKAVALNEPRRLKLLLPDVFPGSLPAGEEAAYRLLIRTQSSAKGSSHRLKEVREVLSDIPLTLASPE